MNCFNCDNARWCEVWGEVTCVAKKIRIYELKDDTCPDFKKRAGGVILDNPCQCDDCKSSR